MTDRTFDDGPYRTAVRPLLAAKRNTAVDQQARLVAVVKTKSDGDEVFMCVVLPGRRFLWFWRRSPRPVSVLGWGTVWRAAKLDGRFARYDSYGPTLSDADKLALTELWEEWMKGHV